MAKSRRRGFTSWFVEPYKQVRLGLMFLLVNGVFAAVFLGVFGYYVLEMYDTVVTYFKLSGQESAVTFEKFSIPIVIGGLLIFIFVVTTILVSVRYTHEIYGPLVSIHRFLDDLLAGRTTVPIHLRESDQLQDLAEKLNNVAERLSTDQRAGPLVAIHRYLDDVLEGKEPAPLKLRDNDHFAELANKLSRLSEILKQR